MRETRETTSTTDRKRGKSARRETVNRKAERSAKYATTGRKHDDRRKGGR